MNKFDFGHPIVQGVDGDELEAGNDSFIDYATSGVAATAVSAVVGTVNSLMGVANLVGADFEYMDERSAVRDTFGSETAEFYGRHKEGIDVSGMIVSTIVPGALAVKAMRAAQTTGRLTNGMTVATGLQNGDVVLGSSAVQAARTQIIQQGRYDGSIANLFSNEAKRNAIAAGLKQNVLEAAVFEATALLTTNQAATLNPEHVSSLTSMGNIVEDNWKFMVAGPAIGAVLDGFKIRGYLDRAWKEHETPVVRKLIAEPLQGLSANMPLGDKATVLARALKQGEASAEGTTVLGQELLGGLRRDLEELMIKGRADESEATRAFFTHALEHESPETFLAGVNRVSHVGLQESDRNLDWSMRAPAPGFLTESETGSGIYADWYNSAKRALGRELDIEELTMIREEADSWDSFLASGLPSGSAYPGPSGRGLAETFMGDQVPFSVRKGSDIPYDQMTPDQRMVAGEIAAARNIVQIQPEDVLYEIWSTQASKKAAKFGYKVPTYDEFRTSVILHELGHTTTNGARQMRVVNSAMAKANSKSELPTVVRELLDLSRKARNGSFEQSLDPYAREMVQSGLAKDMDDAYFKLVKESMANASVPKDALDELGRNSRYLFDAHELLADAARMIANPATAEVAAKSAPTVAKLFNRLGGLARPWNPTKSYYDTVTRKFQTNAVVGVNDLQPGLKLQVTNGKASIRVGNATVKEDPNVFMLDYLRDHLETSGRLDYMDFSKQHAIAGLKTLDNFEKGADGAYAFKHEYDIANMERLLTLTKAEDGLTYRVGDIGMDHKQLQAYIENYKETMRLTLTSKADVYSTEELAHILNADLGDLRGLEDVNYIMQGKQNWAQPRVVKVEYTKLNPDGVNDMARSLPTISARTDIILAQNKTAAAAVIGQGYDRLPQNLRSTIDSLSQADRTGGMISTARGTFGSLLSELQYVGKVVTDLNGIKAQAIEDAFAPYYAKFNHVESKASRAELAMAENFGRRHHTRMLQNADGTAVLYTEDIIAEAKQMAKEAGQPDAWERLIPQMLAEGNHMKLSADVAQFVKFHIDENDKLLGKSRSLATARGQHVSGVSGRFYVPPRDLKDERYFAFVVPSTAAEGVENGKYMVFGRTQEELDSKMALIRKREGARYKIVTRQEVNQYKQLTLDYDKGKVFDEAEFDSSLMKVGTSSEYIPNMDLQGSTALERFRKFHHSKNEALLRSAVELQYSEHFAQLDMLGRQFGRFEEGKLALGFIRKDRDNVYTKARNLALAIRGHDGPVAYLWKSVNDMIGEKGGAAIDNLMRTFSSKARITEADLNVINQKMADLGVEMPFKDVSELLISSTDTRVSRTMPTLVRTMNNLTATFMLRLDALNSIVQTISTPILTSTVLREAMQELQGPQRRQLLDATTVLNPVTKLREPTAAKLQAKAIARFFTPEGKQDLAEYTRLGLIPDFMYEFREAMDFSELTGSHSLQVVNDKLDKIGRIGSKISQHTKAEQFSRFMVIDSMRQLCEIRGITGAERYSVYSSALDKVHGVYRHSQRINLFNGVVGNAIGLYQTYIFNFAQNMVRHLEVGDRRSIATAAALQGSLFGGRSFPGFQTMNSWVAEANSGREDAYTVTGADDPNSWSAYMMYGLGSHVLGVPTDLFSRGDMAVRNSLIVPTSLGEIPSVSVIARAVNAMSSTVGLMTDGDVPAGAAFLHGLAHNGMNRPLQGLATLAMGYVDDKKGVPMFLNTNHVDYDLAQEYNLSAMFARVIGGKPFNEGVLLDNYYRTKQYQLVTKEQIQGVSKKLNLALSQGKELEPEQWENFMLDYEEAGGRLENFNAYASRAMSVMGKSQVTELRAKQEKDGAARRAYRRMMLETEIPDFPVEAVEEVPDITDVPMQ